MSEKKYYSAEAKVAFTPTEEGREEIERLTVEAVAAARKAYAPYSKFKVGAAVLLANGEIVAASNQENAAYPSGLCAERVTLFYANAKYPDVAVRHLLIYAENENGPVEPFITPCGACRQVMTEKEYLQKSPMKVTLVGKTKVVTVPSVEHLLPFTFTTDNLF